MAKLLTGTRIYGTGTVDTQLFVSGTNSATSTTTGALQVVGGVGVGGNLHVGGIIYGAILGTATTATNADNIKTVLQTSSSSHYLTFVDANNSTAAYEALYTTSSLTINPSTGDIVVGRYITASRYVGTLSQAFLDVGATNVTLNGDANDYFLYNRASNFWQFVIASTERMRIDSSGTVLIAGTTPYSDAKLQIVNGDTASGAGGLSQIALQFNSGGFTHFIQTRHNTSQNDGNALVFYLNTGSTAGASSAIGTGNTQTYYMGYLTHRWNTSGTERLRITANGGISFGASGTAYGVSGQILQSNGDAAPTWISTGSLAAANATTATHLSGGTAGQVPYQTAPGVTSFYGPGTAGNVLVSNGTSAPSYNNTLTLAGTTAATSTTTGTLVVVGGVGIGDNLFVNNNINAVSGQFVSTRANNAATGAGQIYLNGASGNRIDFNQNGVAAPAFTTRSAGTKLVLYSNLSGSAVDYAIGIESSSLWSSVPNTGSFFKWYGGTTLAATLTGAGNLTLVGDLAVNGGDITTTQATFNLINTTATTVNFAGDATALTMGASGSGTTNVRNNLTVNGNLTVQGTTTIVDSTVTNIADPIITLGGGTGNSAPTADDNKDRGVAFKYVNNAGTTSTGFFGYDDSTGHFTYVQTATITNEVVSGTKGAMDVNLAGGTAMSVVYQSSPNNTAFLAASTSGFLLQTNGTGSAPTWVSASGVSAGSATYADSIRTISQAGSAVYYPAFVDSNNATNAYESVYTTSSFTINPATGNITAPSFSVQTNTTPATFIKDDNLTSWMYSGKSFSVNAQESSPAGIFFKPDGLAMYVIGTTGDDVNQYSLSVAWDVSTAAFVQVSAAVGETGPLGVFFKPDGLVMYVTGSTNDTVREFSLSVAWDVSTITFVRDFSVAVQDTAPQDLWFKPDGTKMYIVGSTNDRVYEYNLSTAWNVSTAVFLQFFSVAGQDTVPVAVVFNPDGTKMYVLGDVGDDINRYSLSTPWDISTAVFFNNFYVGFQEASVQSLFINFASDTAYIVGTVNDAVYQYTTLTDGIELTSSAGLFIDGSLYTNKTLVVTSGTRIDGTLSVSMATTLASSLTVDSTTNLNAAVTLGTTTSAINIGTSQSTGATIIGGTAQTGGLTLGRSTGAQTVDIAVGATTNGTIKLINVGANGVSGSITNINVGSTVTGALGTLTINSTQTVITSTTNASSTATGALQVRGGVGIGRDLWVGGTINGTATTSSNANTVVTLARTTNASHFLTFVDSNNASAASESVYTTSSFSINPQSGNVGIGTSSPAQKLDVRGYIVSDVNSNSVEGGFYLGNSGHGIRRPVSTNDVYVYTTGGTLYLTANGSTSTQVTILNSGNVGIGAAPTAVTGFGINRFLEIAGSSVPGIVFRPTGSTSEHSILGAGDGLLLGATGAATASGNNVIRFFTSNVNSSNAPTERLRITAAGGIAFGGAANYGSAGQMLQSNGDAAPTWVALSSRTVGTSTQVNTVLQASNASYYPTFVDSNNASATAESFYTTSSFQINPFTGNIQIGMTSQDYQPSSGGNHTLRLNAANTSSIGFHDSGSTIGNLKFSGNYGFEIGAYDGLYGPHNTTLHGNVGIRTLSPGYPLVVQTNGTSASPSPSGSNIALRLQSTQTNYAVSIQFSDNVTNAAFITMQGGGFRFTTSNPGAVQAVNISSSGNVSIGTTSTTNKFEVAGAAGQLFSVSDSFTGTIFSANDVSGIPSIEVLDTGLVKLAQYNGAVAIGTGTITSSTAELSVYGMLYTLGSQGEIRASSEITAYFSSDRRLKENIKLIENPITIIDQIRGVTFDWTDEHMARRGGEDGYFVRKHDIGVIAQEVQAVLPELVGTREDGYLAVKYEKMVPLLIEAIKAQQKTIDSLVKDLDNVKEFINDLKNKNGI